MKKVVEVKMNVMQELSVSSWEELSAAADEEHQSNLATLNRLQRQRAQLSVVALLSHDPNATNEIDQEIAALERRMTGHLATRQLLSSGLEAARAAEQAQMDIDRAKVLAVAANQRAKLAAEVDSKMSDLADVISIWLNSTQATNRPDRAAGNVNRAFWHFFKPSRNQPWRRAIAELSSSLPSMATARPLSSVTDPDVAEAAALEQAATTARAEALETLKSLTPALTATPAKPHQNRLVEPLEIAA